MDRSQWCTNTRHHDPSFRKESEQIQCTKQRFSVQLDVRSTHDIREILGIYVLPISAFDGRLFAIAQRRRKRKPWPRRVKRNCILIRFKDPLKQVEILRG